MFCNPFFAPIFLVFILSLPSQLDAMHRDGEVDEYNHKNCIIQQARPSNNKESALKNDQLSFIFGEAPKDILNEIFKYLKSNELLRLREISKNLKNIVDRDYWKTHVININNRSSSPVIESIKDIPCSDVSLGFNRWEEKDMEQLLSFKHATHLRLVGLGSCNFSTAELFNPFPVALCVSGVLSLVNAIFGMELGTPELFSNLKSLDLSNSNIGDYGVIAFVSQFRKLQTLNISNNSIGHNISGEANAIANLHTLTSLNISGNSFSSETIKPISQLTNLTVLDISNNFVEDKRVVKTLSLLPKLKNFTKNNQRRKSNPRHPFPVFCYEPLPMRRDCPPKRDFKPWMYH